MESNADLFRIGKKFLEDLNYSELMNGAQQLDKDNLILFRYALAFISPVFYGFFTSDISIVDSNCFEAYIDALYIVTEKRRTYSWI